MQISNVGKNFSTNMLLLIVVVCKEIALVLSVTNVLTEYFPVVMYIMLYMLV